jgi:predicted outer membrane protein
MLANSTSTTVKQLAAQIYKNHRELNSQLRLFAEKKNINTDNQLSITRQKDYDNFSAIAEAERIFADEIIAASLLNIETYMQKAETEGDAEIRKFASGNISVLRHHVSMAEEVSNEVKGKICL